MRSFLTRLIMLDMGCEEAPCVRICLDYLGVFSGCESLPGWPWQGPIAHSPMPRFSAQQTRSSDR